MKKTIIALFLISFITSVVFAQEKPNDKISLKITRKGVSQTIPVSVVSFNFIKLGESSDNINTLSTVTITTAQFDHFLLRAASGNKDNRFEATITLYGESGKVKKVIELKNAFISQLSETFGNAADDNSYNHIFIIETNDLIVDGVKL
ncbi:MAG: hypothetical protein ABI237_08370 [Ginsengibacter sp.]